MHDRRIRKTKLQLRAGLTKLLSEKSINEITVKELVDKADINRSTFYLHYKDIYDMLEKIEAELLDQLMLITEKHKTEYNGNLNPSYLVDLFKVLSENLDIVSVFLGPNGDIAFVNKIKHMISDKIIENIDTMTSKHSQADIEFTFSFYLNGCIGLIEHWINTGAKESPEHLAKLCFTLINNGIKNYLNDSIFAS